MMKIMVIEIINAHDHTYNSDNGNDPGSNDNNGYSLTMIKNDGSNNFNGNINHCYQTL